MSTLLLLLLLLLFSYNNEILSYNSTLVPVNNHVHFGEVEYFIFNYTLSNTSYINSIPPLVYLKTHKTGSSTLANIFHRIADIRNLTIMLPKGDVKLGWPYSFPGKAVKNLYAYHSIDMIANHAVLNVKKMAEYMKSSSPLFVTILRQPWSRGISAYNYFKFQGSWDDHLSFLETQDTIEPDKKHNSPQKYKNAQAFDLGWYEKNNYTTKYDNNTNKINEFVTHIDNTFDLVMITEELDRSLVLLSQLLNITINEMVYHRFKIQSTKKEFIPSNSTKARYEAANAIDVALYEFFQRRFAEQWDAACLDAKRAREVDSSVELLPDRLKRFQALNSGLQSACDNGEVECVESFLTDSYYYTDAMRGYNNNDNHDKQKHTDFDLIT